MEPEILAYIIGLSIGLTIFFITTIVVCVRRRQKARRNVGYIVDAPVVVTSATHTAPGGYPVSQIPPQGGVAANVYATPYPTGQLNMTHATHMPQQPQAGFQPQVPYPPYPPMGVQPATHMNPPSYESAVTGFGTGAPSNVPYEKQAPYNPNYSSQ